METSEKANTSEYYNILITPSMDMFLPAMVTMLSAMKNAGRPCHFYIMQSDFSEESREEYRKFIGDYLGNQIEFIDVNDEDFQIFEPFKRRYGTYYKLAAAQFLPETVERILFLDTDSYVMKNLETFYKTDFEDNFMVGCDNVILQSEKEKFASDGVERRGFVNCGVLLLNICKLREQGPSLKDYATIVQNFTRGYLFDQGIISYIFENKIKLLPNYKYNHMMRFSASANVVNTYGWIFTLTPEQKRELLVETYHNEEYDPDQADTIIHFPGVTKPWQVMPEISKKGIDGIKDIPRVEKFGPSLTKKDIERFYLDWWILAKEIPSNYFLQLLNGSAISHYENILRRKDQFTKWIKNAQNFCQTLCLDYLGDRKFDRFLRNIAQKDLAVLKFHDEAGVILMKAASAHGVNVIFQSPKGTLDELSAEEFDICRRADCIISCSVHGVVKTHERDGVKCIDIWDILRDDSLTEDLPAVPEASSETLAAIADEARHAKEICENIEKLAQN